MERTSRDLLGFPSKEPAFARPTEFIFAIYGFICQAAPAPRTVSWIRRSGISLTLG